MPVQLLPGKFIEFWGSFSGQEIKRPRPHFRFKRRYGMYL